MESVMRISTLAMFLAVSLLAVTYTGRAIGADPPTPTPTAEATASPSVTAPTAASPVSSSKDGKSNTASQSDYSPWFALFMIAVSGLFGGLVDGLRSTRSYTFRFSGTTKELGTLGDGLIGMLAAIAIFAFADSIFGSALMLGDRIKAWQVIKLVAWGVLSGWAGTKLLDDLSNKARDLIQRQTGTEVAQQLAAVQSGISSVREAEQQHTLFLSKLATLAKGVKDDKVEALAKKAVSNYEAVLEKSPSNREARNGLANTLADLGAYYLRDPADPDEANPRFERAIKLQDALIAEDPGFAKAYYNRACYKAVANRPVAEVTTDLDEAIRRDATFREYARLDVDLERVHSDPWWNREIVAKLQTQVAVATP